MLAAVFASVNIVPATVKVPLALRLVPVIAPLKFPSILASKVPVVTVMSPLDVPVAVVVPIINLSSLSSHPIKALFPELPLSIIIPQSLVLASVGVNPLFNSIKLSFTDVLVVSIVVVVPFIVKLPVTVKLSFIVTSEVV